MSNCYDKQRENIYAHVSNMSPKSSYLIGIIHRCLQEWLSLYLHRLVVVVVVVFHNVDAIVGAVVIDAVAIDAVSIDAVDAAGTRTIQTNVVPIIVVVHRTVVQIDGKILMFART